MSKKIRISDLPEFDPSKYLDDDEAVAHYISLAIEDGDPGLLAAALGDVARARGMTQVAVDPGLRRDDGRDFMVTSTSTAINCI